MAHVKTVTTKLPTYLELLLHDNSSIKLVFQEIKPPVPLEVKTLDSPEIAILDLSKEISTLDLTGTPLETDLGDDDTLCANVILQRPHSWTSQEAHQYPLALSDARNVINEQLKSRKTNETIYCICDANDPQRTVGLGAMVNPHKICRILVYILPCFYQNHEITTLDHMIKEHLKSVRRRKTNVPVKVSTRKRYDLFGCDLKNCLTVQGSEFNGHIFVEISTNEQTNVSQNHQANFQVVVGHKDSPLISFWEDLCVIQSYVKLLENAKMLNDGTIINLRSNTDENEIRSLIGDLFINVAGKKLMPQKLDLKNLRQLNTADLLWIILKKCKTLSDLRDSFHFFFEEIAEKQSRILISSDNNSAVAEIVRGIVAGRVAVPTISFLQSVELLVDLGLAKLKDDYLAILTSFSTIVQEEYVKKWHELCSENQGLHSNVAAQRRTRISISRTTAITDLTSSKLKLTFLDSMHKVAEFMFLYKDNLPVVEQIFNSYCESLCDHFIVKFPKVIQTCDFKQARLCKFHFDISSTEAAVLVKDKSVVSVTSTLYSALHRSEVWTVLHFSDYPIFPPSVFQDYEIPNTQNDIKLLYVTKLVKYVENL